MRNLADAIENFIIAELLEAQKNALLVQRNELAERMSCAPSQISYVLNTRFTPERGFMVESRRGSGGFIRIMRLEEGKSTQGNLLRTLAENKNNKPSVDEVVDELAAQQMITARESALLHYLLQIIDADENKKEQVLHGAIKMLSAATRG